MVEIRDRYSKIIHTYYGADLRGADLRGADLREANLRGADLYGANLHGADLRGADLRGADLHGADLRGANLRGADLRGADLHGADLRGANLQQGTTKLNWQSHALLGEILFRAAGQDVAKRMVAGVIAISLDWCWKDFAKIEHSEKEWAINELSQWATKDEKDVPELITNYIANKKANNDKNTI